MKRKKQRLNISADDAAELLRGHQATKDTDKTSCNIPRPARDERDPYGAIRTQMLDQRTHFHKLYPPGKHQPGMHQHDVHAKYLAKHPGFEAEYEAELQRRAKEGRT